MFACYNQDPVLNLLVARGIQLDRDEHNGFERKHIFRYFHQFSLYFDVHSYNIYVLDFRKVRLDPVCVTFGVFSFYVLHYRPMTCKPYRRC
jgi:hypothetical protein